MTDIVEQTKQVAAQLSAERFQGWVNPLVINVMEAAAEIERLRLSLSEAIAQRDAAFEMSKCECGTDEACRNLVEARATGRREGLSEAMKIADALRDEQRKFQTHASANGFKSEARDHESMKFAAVHLSSAIRAAMEKEE